jgi:hypothetical protein
MGHTIYISDQYGASGVGAEHRLDSATSQRQKYLNIKMAPDQQIGSEPAGPQNQHVQKAKLAIGKHNVSKVLHKLHQADNTE